MFPHKTGYNLIAESVEYASIIFGMGMVRILFNLHDVTKTVCYDMDETGISCSKFLSPGSAWANTAFEGSQFYSIGVPKFYSWVNVISAYVYNDLG